MLVTGAHGMVGSYVKEIFSDCDLILTDLPVYDVTNNDVVLDLVKTSKPDFVLHLAAATDVDRCETDHQYAYSANVTATQNVAQACAKFNAIMIYISTGYVFNGSGRYAHSETDKPDPANYYGKTKLMGEQAVQEILRNYYIFRAEWMIGGGPKRDKKFVGKIIEMARAGKDIEAVDDMFSTPTFAKDFVNGIKQVIQTNQYGLYHMANQGICSRYEMALEIVRLLDLNVKVTPVPSSRFPLPAPRAQSSGIMNARLEEMGLDIMPKWEETLKKYLEEWVRSS